MYKVTTIIESTCKKLGIKYCSPYHEDILDYQKDINKLAEHYLKIKEIIGDLVELEEKYDINGLKKLFEIDIKALEKIDHDLVTQANRLIKAKEKKQCLG